MSNASGSRRGTNPPGWSTVSSGRTPLFRWAILAIALAVVASWVFASGTGENTEAGASASIEQKTSDRPGGTGDVALPEFASAATGPDSPFDLEPSQSPELAGPSEGVEDELVEQHGIVVTSAGEAVAGASVLAVRVSDGSGDGYSGDGYEHEGEQGDARTDDDGRFSLSLPAGMWRVSASFENGSTAEPALVVLKAGEAPRSLRLVLAPGSFLHGTVVSARDRAVVITHCVARIVGTGMSAPCGRSGRFVLGPLPQGVATLSVHATGYVPREATVMLDKPGNVAVELALLSGGRVEGVVDGPSRFRLMHPVVVRTEHYSLGDAERAGIVESQAFLDAYGRFALEDVAPGRLRVRASLQGHGDAVSREVVLSEGMTVDVGDLRIQSGVVIEGVVVHANQSPVANARVIASRPGESEPAGFDRADSEGLFLFDGLSPGEWVLTAVAPSGSGGITRVTAGDGAPTTARIVLDSGTITGFVKNREGSGIAGAIVDAALLEGGFEASAVTKADGGFSLDGLPRGAYHVRARAMRGGAVLGEAERRGVRTGSTTTLVIVESGRIEGQVSDAVGLAVTDFAVTVVPTDLAAGESVDSRYRSFPVLSSDGAFTAEGLPPGRYSVRVSAAGHSSASTSVVVRPGEVAAARLRLQAGATLTGQLVVGDARAPVPGCVIREEALEIVSGLPDRGSSVTTTDVRGLFELRGVAAGVRRVVATCPDGGVAQTRVRLEAGGHEDVVLRVTNEKPAEDEYAGIGAVLAQRGPRVVVMRVTEGGPGFLAGILPGDEVLAVDGFSVEGMPVHGVSQRIRGPVGIPVHLVLRRAGGDPFELVAERVRIAAQ